MRGLTAAAVAEVARGEIRGTMPQGELSAVTTDSRQVIPGSLFAAIPGERVDGHDFIPSAFEKGACCALCERFVESPLPQIRVKDTQQALQAIAAYYRGLLQIPVVGVTGSVGKTTAKEMIWSVLSENYSTLKTEGNFNNELGVPLTLFRLRENHEAAVVEMGISHFGEMTRLTAMARPRIAVFTMIGDAHLEFLGDRAGVLRAKGEIVSGMPKDGVVIANGDDELLRTHDFGLRTVLFGKSEGCNVRAVDIRNTGRLGIDCVIESGKRRICVSIPGFGRHMIYAALMGAAVGMELGLSDEQIQRGIEHFQTVGSRGRILNTKSIVIIDDCYNANPTSAGSAIDSLSDMPGRHVAILGDMLELGENGPSLHYEVGRRAAETGAYVIACGPIARNIAEGAGTPDSWYPDTESLIAALPEYIEKGDTVLVKASHAMGFDAVVRVLEELSPE